MTDFLIGPYIVLVLLSHPRTNGRRRYIGYLTPTLLIFLWWAFIATLFIGIRFEYYNQDHLVSGLLKLGKFSLYGLAGVATIRAIGRGGPSTRRGFYWSLLISAVLIGLTLLVTENSTSALSPDLFDNGSSSVYLDNPITITMAILIVFVAGSLLVGNVSSAWRRAAAVGLVLMGLGFVFAEGRGGWLACIVGLTYVFLRARLSRSIFALFIAVSLFMYTYDQIPNFRHTIDRTLYPDETYLTTYKAGVFGIDDGVRLRTFLEEAPKIAYSPILGQGFFHRGGQTGIYSTG
ncbi:MAG: hypothetical protein KC547_10170, partial [Anaerolineae bacterium]|nr:hypothetical protein [Anaerolineae bacterium]